MKLKLKLNLIIVLAAAILGVLSLTVTGFTLISVSRIQDANLKVEKEADFELTANHAKFHSVQIQQFLTDASLTREADSIKEAKENLDLLEKDIDSLELKHPELQGKFEEIRSRGRGLHSVGLEMSKAYWDQGRAAGDAIMKRPGNGLDASTLQVAKLLEDLLENALLFQKSAEDTLKSSIHALVVQTIFMSLLILLVTGFVFSVLFVRLKPISVITSRLEKNSENLSSASLSMKDNASGMANANAHQASATQQTAASLEEIRAMVGKTAENSERLKSGAQTSQGLVNSGKAKLQILEQQLQEIEVETKKLVSDVESGNLEVRSIVDIISEIGGKTKVINDIVFQTKLLSFNASVEAARAGEHGKGFAVVAEEVGNLASMSGQAAKEISGMLEKGTSSVEAIIKSNADRIQNSIEVNKVKIAKGVETAGECQQAFDKIVTHVDEVREVSDEITEAIEEQQKGLNEITKALSSLESATQSNVISSETVKENSIMLSGAVDQLTLTIEEIKTIVSGQTENENRSVHPSDEDQSGSDVHDSLWGRAA